mmetsp:Transcript_12197/g.25606  ORF Transcript_12197/g.25606 Transcript_12197/m.25606 type:complete len:121 (+) Transcript_12197:81-443(+)
MSTPEEVREIRARQYQNRQQELEDDWELTSFLQGYVTIDGRRWPKWIFAAVLIWFGFAGPKVLGYVLIFLIVYFIYTRTYLQGIRSPAQLWEALKAASATPQATPKKEKKRGPTKPSRHS